MSWKRLREACGRRLHKGPTNSHRLFGEGLARLLCRANCWLSLLVLGGCVYDHRVVQAIMERRRRAKEAEGARIAAAPSVGPLRYTGRVRFYVADAYRAQHGEWRQPLEDLIDAASSFAGPTFAFRFSAVEVRAWSPRCAQDELAPCLDELAQLDVGEDGLWIVGVLGDTPRYTASFEQLGIARLVSSHMVLRDVADLAERDAIDRAFASHTPGDRAEIYTRRKRHKRLAVFLHEWAHTLGGLHSRDGEDLLHSSYDDRMSAFGDANAGLLGASLESRFAGDNKSLLAYVERLDASRFVGHEHAGLLAQLRALASAPKATAPSPQALAPSAGVAPSAAPARDAAPSRGNEGALPAGLTAADGEAYRLSERASLAGDAAGAWHSLRPLVERYPSSYPVQHSACTLSMRVGDAAAAQRACPRVQQLSASALPAPGVR